MRVDIDAMDRFIFEENESVLALHAADAGQRTALGHMTVEEIDVLRDRPEISVLTISGLEQDTFEYLIHQYGYQLRVLTIISPKIGDLSMLGSLPQLEYLTVDRNYCISSLWDMTENTALKGLRIGSFTKLNSIDGIQRARNLEYFVYDDGLWSKTALESLMPLAGLPLRYFALYVKTIVDGDMSVFEQLPRLEQFTCPLHLLETEKFAWIKANCPDLKGRALQAYEMFRDGTACIVGKRKPCFKVEGNEKRIKKYVDSFNRLVGQYRGKPFGSVFPFNESPSPEPRNT